MQTWMIWTAQPVDNKALRVFAESLGGYWNDALGDGVVIERGGGRVFIALASTSCDDILQDDVEYATLKLGQRPPSMLSMRIGHAVNSEDVALEIASTAIERWGGFLDMNRP
jgi:hypothetical protein